jgi:Uma2 family endonuclease
MTTISKPRGPWTSADLAYMRDNSARHEIVNGELFGSRPPHWQHQHTCGNFLYVLAEWSTHNNRGQVSINPSIDFSDTDIVAPDVVWISNERFVFLLNEEGHLTDAPELVVEVLLPGPQQERRDRQFKRKLYETQGVREYWIADWRLRQVEVYRRVEIELRLIATLLPEDTLTTPLLPGFACPVHRLFS